MLGKKYYVAAIAIAVLAIAQCVWGVDGTWSSTAATGGWSTTTNWVSGTVASDAGYTADFNSVDVPSGGINVSLDTYPLYIGNLVFGDTDTSTPGGWLVTDGGAGNYLDLSVNSGSVPNITVNTLGGTAVVQFNAGIYTVQGLNKLGSGTLVLTSPGQLMSGDFTVSAGTLKLAASDNSDNMLEPYYLDYYGQRHIGSGRSQPNYLRKY